VTALAPLPERFASNDTQLSDEQMMRLSGPLAEADTLDAIDPAERIYAVTVGGGYPQMAPFVFLGPRRTLGWVRIGEERTTFDAPLRMLNVIGVPLPDEENFTSGRFAPMIKAPVGTGDLLDEIRDYLDQIWLQQAEAACSAVSTASATILFDIPGALRKARSQAGLPVQDFAAMFGVKRRQFYNLASGEDTPGSENEQRIARVAQTLSEISDWVEGNSRKVRALLLARLGGDSIYEAAVADDPDRLESAVERARAAAAQDVSLAPRLAPSNRATPDEAAAVREFLRSTRDETGAASD